MGTNRPTGDVGFDGHWIQHVGRCVKCKGKTRQETPVLNMAVCQNLVPLVNTKIAGLKWM